MSKATSPKVSAQIKQLRSFSDYKETREERRKRIDKENGVESETDSMAMSIHSPLYNEIQGIPTGSYGTARHTKHINSLIDKYDYQGVGLADMPQEHIKAKMKGQFQGIFNTDTFDQSILNGIVGPNKLPQLMNKTQHRSMHIDKASPKSGDVTMVEHKVKQMKKTNEYGNKIKTSAHGRAASQDFTMQLITQTKQQIRENIASATFHNKNFIRQQQNKELASKIENEEKFNALKEALDQGLAQTQTSTLAGAKTKYQANFRLNQNSQFLSNTNGQASNHDTVNPDKFQTIQNTTASANTLAGGGTFGKGPFGITAQSINRNSGNALYNNTFMDLYDMRSAATRTATNLIDANINSVKDYKLKVLKQQQAYIEEIHAQQMSIKDVSKQNGLFNLQKVLPQKFQEIFLEQTSRESYGHSNLFNTMNGLNSCFTEVLDSVAAYRADLAIMLQQLIETYNSVFLQQYEVFYDEKLQKELQLDAQIDHCKQVEADFAKTKEELLKKQEFCAHYIQSKDDEIKRQESKLADYLSQIVTLNQIHKADKLDEQQQEKNYQEKKLEHMEKPQNAEGFDKSKRVAIKQAGMVHTQLLHDEAVIPDLKMAVQESLDNIDDRNEIVEDLYEVVKKMLTTKQKSVKCQTEQACMNNAQTYEYYSYGDSSSKHSERHSSQERNILDEKLEKIKKERGIDVKEHDSEKENDEKKEEETKNLTNEDPKDLDVEMLDKVDGFNGEEDKVTSSEAYDVISRQSKVSKRNPQRKLTRKSSSVSNSSKMRFNKNMRQDSKRELSSKNSRSRRKTSESHQSKEQQAVQENFNLLDVPIQHHNETMRQLGLHGQNKMYHLHNILEKISLKIKKRKMQELDQDPTKINRNETWKIPYRIIAFCQNRILQFEKEPELVEKYEYMAWYKFKELVFDIYDHRILHAPELNGSVNTNYCALNEHLLIFMMERYKKRAKAEEKIVNLLINLRYYYDNWQRAKIFAWNLQLTHNKADSAIRLAKEGEEKERASQEPMDEYGDVKIFTQPHAYLHDQDCSDNDIFSQEFFLHAFSLLSTDRPNFLESKEGMTYVRIKHHEKVASKIIPMLKGGDLQKWNLKVRRIVKRIKNKQGNEADYLDLDIIVGMMIHEFKDQRRIFQRDLQKNYLRFMESTKAECELENLAEIIKATEPDQNEVSLDNPLMKYTGQMAMVRGYIYAAIASEDNTNVIQDTAFIAGCNRYALDNPVPTVSTRCGLYGNSRDVMILLQEAERIYGKPLKVDYKTYGSHNMGLKPKLTSSTTRKLGLNMMKMGEKEKDDEDMVKRKPEQIVEETVRDTEREALQEKTTIQNNKQLLQGYHQPGKQNPAEQLGPQVTQIMMGGTKFKIKSIRKKTDKKSMKTDLNLNDNKSAFDGFVYEFEEIDPSKKKLQNMNDGVKEKATNAQCGVSGNKIIIPSFQTTAKIFGQHFLILQEMKYKIDLLKQAYFGQMDADKTWYQVEQILKVLDTGCTYLDFPEDQKIEKYIRPRGFTEEGDLIDPMIAFQKAQKARQDDGSLNDDNESSPFMGKSISQSVSQMGGSEYKLGQRANSLVSSNLNVVDVPNTTIMELPVLEETREENNLVSKSAMKKIKASSRPVPKSKSVRSGINSTNTKDRTAVGIKEIMELDSDKVKSRKDLK